MLVLVNIGALAIVVALSRGVLENEGSIVCLTGVCGSGLLDTLVVLDIVKEFEMFHANPAPITETVDEAVFEKVLQVTGTLTRPVPVTGLPSGPSTKAFG